MFLASCAVANVFQNAQEAVPPATSVSVGTIERVTRDLVDPKMEGRGTAQAGGLRAARYLAQQFADLKLGPLGDHRTFLQRTDMISGRFDPHSSISIDGKKLSKDVDFALDDQQLPNLPANGLHVEGPVTLLSIPLRKLKSSDFEGVNLKGRVVALVLGSIKDVPQQALEGFSQSDLAKELQKMGAKAIVRLTNAPVTGGVQDYSKRIGVLHIHSSAWELPFPSLSGEASRLLVPKFERLPLNAKPVIADLSHRIRLDLAVDRTATSDADNVVGVVQGEDPVLRSEAVVITAHYDAYGVAPDGTIYPGAGDNAIGVAKLVSLAEALQKSSKKLRRSVIFICTTGEEMGLFGAKYWVNHPTWPLSKVAANFNFDGLGTDAWGRLRTAYAIGASHSDLTALLRQVAINMKISLMPDSNKAEETYLRADQYEFARWGIPTVYVLGFDNIFTIAKRIGDFEQADYHMPSDTIGRNWVWEGAADLARYYLLAIEQVANGDKMPTWNSDSPFNHPRGWNPRAAFWD